MVAAPSSEPITSSCANRSACARNGLGAELAFAILAAAPDDARLEPILRERDLHQVEAERIADAAGEQLDDRERLLGRGERADGAQQAQPCRGTLIPPRAETPERILDRAGGALDDGDARDLLDGGAALDADDALHVRRERRRGEALDAAHDLDERGIPVRRVRDRERAALLVHAREDPRARRVGVHDAVVAALRRQPEAVLIGDVDRDEDVGAELRP